MNSNVQMPYHNVPVVHPHVTTLLQSHTRHTIVSYCIAVAMVVVAIVAIMMWTTKGQSEYEPHFEAMPADPTKVLECGDDSQAYSAQTQATTSKCIFSGDMTLPHNLGVTESDVIRKCNARIDCGGYMMRIASTYEPCTHLDSSGTISQVPGCIITPYNRGQPEYMLFSASAMRDLAQVSHIVQGANHEVRTTTYVRR